MRQKLWVTILLLAVGYSGYYLCRSSFSIAKPLLLEAFPTLDKAKLGSIASIATLFYALGKLIHGPLADKIGGKPMFLYGMVGAILFSILFGLGGPPLFTLAWCGNRFVQSAGWGGMIRVVSQWTPRQRYGAVMSMVSLSYLFGDFVSRLLLGYWVGQKVGWAGLFLYSAAGLFLIAIPVVLFLKERPEQPVIQEEKLEVKSSGPAPSLFQNPSFWMVCGLSFCFTLLRESFGEWTPTFLNEFAKMSKSAAGEASSVFPLLGGISVLLIGFLSDRVSKGGSPLDRIKLIPIGLALAGLTMIAVGQGSALSSTLIVVLVGAIAFFLIGPYSLLAGATSLDFGGDKNAATAAGWIDGVGYFGGILSGYGVGSLAQNLGWSAAMSALGGFCLVTAVALVVILQIQKQKLRNA